MADIKEDIYNQIIKEYQFTGSIIDIAEKLGISCTKVRRVLITEGLWSSRTSEEIGKLAKEGYSSGQISARLHITIKNVQAYLPYTRGMLDTTCPVKQYEAAIIGIGYSRQAMQWTHALFVTKIKISQTKRRKSFFLQNKVTITR